MTFDNDLSKLQAVKYLKININCRKNLMPRVIGMHSYKGQFVDLCPPTAIRGPQASRKRWPNLKRTQSGSV
jgi:hypothetical protein